jgi:hypothetical protein
MASIARKPMPNDFLGLVGKLWPLAALLGLVAGAIWYIASLDGRVRQLENQLHALALSPVLERRAEPLTSTAPSAKTDPTPGVSKTPPMASSAEPTVIYANNPLQQTCADLAKRAAKGIEDGRPSTVGQPLQALMKEIGCDALKPR